MGGEGAIQVRGPSKVHARIIPDLGGVVPLLGAPEAPAGSCRNQGHCYRITEWWGLAGTSVGHLVQPSCQSRVTYSRLHRTLSSRELNISREGDSTTSLGSLFQCSGTQLLSVAGVIYVNSRMM